VETLSAVGEFLKAQGDKPGAQEAMQQLQGLIQSMMQMGGGGGESPAMPSSTGTGKVPENGAGGPQIM
jgi:phage-related minor tail protein